MESLLTTSVAQNASDLHLCSGEKTIIRQNGQLVALNENGLVAQDLERYLLSLLNPAQRSQLKQQGQIDFAYQHPTLGRFRVNVFYQQKGIAATFRVINAKPRYLADIGVPDIVRQLITKKQGLILITGATGSGKSTTLSAIIHHLNQHQTKHIITLEDPIEFIYHSHFSLIQQREIGTHCISFLAGLQAILRQDPDVIMIGEMRDKITAQAALRAAETGHLVLATLHTNSAVQSIHRIIELFPPSSSTLIRGQLAQILLAVIAQQLVADGVTRKAIFEILINTSSVSHLIEEGKIKQIVSIMQTGQQYGMQMMPKIDK